LLARGEELQIESGVTSELLGMCKESVRSGAIASIATMPFGFVFQSMDFRVGYDGRKLAEVLANRKFKDPSYTLRTCMMSAKKEK
jgi:hypothetical protein